MVSIVTDEKDSNIGERLERILQNSGQKTTLLAVADSDIKPCYACGGCETKTYGKCVVRDDMDKILPRLAESDSWIYIMQITWGNPSYQIKKVLDKSALLGSRFYRTRHGELVKGICVDAKKIVSIGITEGTDTEEQQDFVFWANEMANIMDIGGITRVWGKNPTDNDLQILAKEVIG